MQIIDAEQRRTPDRLREDEIIAWSPDRFDGNFGNHVKSLIAQSKPKSKSYDLDFFVVYTEYNMVVFFTVLSLSD